MRDWEINGRFMSATAVNQKLSSVYVAMGNGAFFAAVTAYITMDTPWLMAATVGWLSIALFIAQFAMILVIGKAMEKWGPQTGLLMFYFIAVTMGITLAPMLKHYSGASIAQAFGMACVTLFLAAGYGYFSKRSLASVGKFMFVGLIGVIIASIVNIFLQNSAMQMVVDVLTVVIFVGLAAYDSQNIRNQLMQAAPEEAEKVVILGALGMWLNLVNLFSVLLRLTGDKE